MSEQSIQASLIKHLKAEGWLVYKTITVSPNGYPDVIAHKSGKTLLVEVKDIYGKLSPVQRETHRRLINHGIDVITVKSKEELIASLIERNI